MPLPKTRDFDENGENHEFAFYTPKQGVLVVRSPKETKMTKMAGATQAKPWFTKNGVFTTLSGGRYFPAPWRVSPKTGVSDGVSHGVSPAFGPRAPERPKLRRADTQTPTR